MTVRNLATLDRTVFQPLGRILQEAFSDGFNALGLPHWGTRPAPCVVPSSGYGLAYFGKVTDGKSDGIAGYFQGHLVGTATGPCYGVSTWLEVKAAAVALNEAVGLDCGVYAEATCVLAAAEVSAAKFATYVPVGSPPIGHYQFYFNTDQAGDVPDAWFKSKNKEAVAFSIGAAETATKNGDICIMIESAKKYIRTYDGTS